MIFLIFGFGFWFFLYSFLYFFCFVFGFCYYKQQTQQPQQQKNKTLNGQAACMSLIAVCVEDAVQLLVAIISSAQSMTS